MSTTRAKLAGAVAKILVPAFLAVVAACSGPSTEPSRDEVKRHLGECSRQYGYDPGRTAVAEDQLAPGERLWRDCAYAAIEQFVIPRSLVSSSYRSLIAEDREMTDAIERGGLTRSQRRSRIEAALSRIDAAEQELQRQRLEETRRTAQQTETIWQMQQQAIMASQLSAVRAGMR